MAGLTAGAIPAHASSATSTIVVHVAMRPPFGNILTNDAGRSLYIKPIGSCTGSCLSIWPPLLMPRGTTMPGGARCLSTVRFGLHRLQVEYMMLRLYTFSGDTGTSVNGNGVGGFVVAKVSRTCP
jgi:hypothetical protein